MKSLTKKELIELKFKKGELIHDGIFHQSFWLERDGSYMCVTNEFDSNKKFVKQVFSINDREMKKQYTFLELRVLINIMFLNEKKIN